MLRFEPDVPTTPEYDAVRAEYPGCVLLALGDRAGVIEQRAECTALDAHVYPERVLAKKVKKSATRREAS